MIDYADEVSLATHEKYMVQAIEEAVAAVEEDEVPIGAVIVHGGRVVARAHNQREQLRDPTAHAEMIAITQAAESLRSWRLEECTLYVTLEPCPMCAGALVHARVDRVVYGCTDPKAGAVDTLFSIGRDARLNHVFEVQGGLLAEESARLLRAFFESLRAQGKK